VTTSPSSPATSVIRLTRRLAVHEPDEVHDQVERRGDLLADRAHRELDAAHQDEHLEAVHGRRGACSRGSSSATLVAGVHRLEHVERLGAADLADDDPVGRMRRAFRTSSRIRTSPSPSTFGGRDSSATTWRC
jgi:hypothetical protein